MLKNIVMLQARMESSRLPGKVLMPINGKPMIEWQIRRILQAKLIEGLVVVIPDTKENDGLNVFLQSFEVDVFRGSLNNVFDRFYQASKKFRSEAIVRLTADCPLIMPQMIDEMLEYFDKKKPDYLCNTIVETLPDGLDIEIFRAELLNELQASSLSKSEQENVTPRIWANPDIFLVADYPHTYNLGHERWTVDYPEDLRFISELFYYYGEDSINIAIDDVLNYIKLHPSKVNQQSSEFRNLVNKNLD